MLNSYNGKKYNIFFQKKKYNLHTNSKKKKIVITYNINVFDMITCSDKIHI